MHMYDSTASAEEQLTHMRLDKSLFEWEQVRVHYPQHILLLSLRN